MAEPEEAVELGAASPASDEHVVVVENEADEDVSQGHEEPEEDTAPLADSGARDADDNDNDDNNDRANDDSDRANDASDVNNDDNKDDAPISKRVSFEPVAHPGGSVPDELLPVADAGFQRQPSESAAQRALSYDVAELPGMPSVSALGARTSTQTNSFIAFPTMRLKKRAQQQRRPRESVDEAGQPSVQRAQRYRDITCPRNRDGASYTKYSIWNFKELDFRRFGVGIELYFFLVKKLGYIFLILAFLSLPSLVLYTLGDEVQKEQYALERTMLGNLGLANNITTVDDIPKQKVGLIVSLNDLLICLVFLALLVRLGVEMDARVREYKRRVVTVASYTVAVYDVPEAAVPRSEIKAHFEQFGPVVDVAVVFNNGRVITKYAERGRLRKRMAAALAHRNHALFKKLKLRVAELDDRIETLNDELDKVALAYFVTFNEQESVRECLHAYPDRVFARLCQSSDRRFRGKRITVSRAPEPSDIIFPNLEKWSWWTHARRRIVSSLATAAVIFASASIVYAAQFYQSRLSTEKDCGAERVWTRAEAQTGNKLAIDCYCRQLGSDALDEDLCDEWVDRWLVSRFLILASAGAILITNILLRHVAWRLVDYERHISRTKAQARLAVRLLIGLFINSALVIFLVNMNLSSIGFHIAFSGPYTDFVPDWFAVVGTSVLFALGLNAFSPHGVPFIAIPFAKCKRRRAAKTAATQAEMNEAFSGAMFHLAERIAVVLNVVFSCLFFSSGIPLLYALGAFSFMVIYWFEKTSFLRYYALPPRYDERLAELAVTKLPYAVVLHLVMAVAFYSCPVLLSYDFTNDTVHDNIDTVEADMLDIKGRLKLWNVFPLACLLILLLLWGLFDYTILDRFRKCRRRRLFDRTSTLIGTELTHSEASKKMRLERYHVSEQRDLADAFLVTESKRQLADTIEESMDRLARLETLEAGERKEAEEKKKEEKEEEDETGEEEVRRVMTKDPVEFSETFVVHGSMEDISLDPSVFIDHSCPHCSKLIQIVDTGDIQEYSCPSCSLNFEV